MARGSPDRGAVEARIVYWGVDGAGKSTNLRTIHDKLRPDNRGDLLELPTRLDPTVRYELLPIELGEVRGTRMRLQVIAVPGGPEQAPTRKQLLDCADGLVFVVDARRERLEDNLASLDELRRSLAAYGRSLDSLPVVVQYNKHDLSDPSALEGLHRKLDVPGAAVFETVATESAGVLRTLTTISKRVLKVLREQADAEAAREAGAGARPQPEPSAPATPATAPPPPRPPAARPAPAPGFEPTRIMEAGLVAEARGAAEGRAGERTTLEAQSALDRSWHELEQETKQEAGLRVGPDLRVVSVGTARLEGSRSVRVPLVLGNDEGETASFSLSVRLDPLLDGEEP